VIPEVDRPTAAQPTNGKVVRAGHEVGTGVGADLGAVLGEGAVTTWCRPFSIAL
jgi:hypothetical protein